MSKELNTLAPKKYSGNYAGATPTLDTTDGILVGDYAIDTSTTPYTIWQCTSNTEGSPTYLNITSGLNGFTGITYVDGSRTDDYEEDGTFTKPFKTIGEAIHAATGANAILLNVGTYEEDLTIDEDTVIISISQCSSAEIHTIIKGKTTVDGDGIKVNLIAVELQNTDDLVLDVVECDTIIAKDCKFCRENSNDACISIATIDTTMHIRGGRGVGTCTLTTADSKLTVEGFHGEDMPIIATAGTLTALSSFLGDITNTAANTRLYSCPIVGDIVSDDASGLMYVTNASIGGNITVSAGILNIDIQNLTGYITHTGGVLVVTNLQNINGDDGSGNAVVSTADGFSVLAIVNSNIQDFNGVVKKINKTGDCGYILQSRRNLADDVITGTRYAYYTYDQDIQNTSTVSGASVKDALETLGSNSSMPANKLTAKVLYGGI
jgi:hypothetical protein